MTDTATKPVTAEIIRHPEPAHHMPPLMVVSPDGTPPQRPVVAAISRVMKEVGAVEKRGENKFHGYKYATAADVAFALQRLMAENGLVVIQRERDTRYDDAMGMLAVRYDFDVMHASGDALAPVQMTGMSRAKDSKGGFDDKATNKCHTAARKYFLLGLFQIPSGDYPDPDAEETPAAPPPRKSRAQAYQEQNGSDETPERPRDGRSVDRSLSQMGTSSKPADTPVSHKFEAINGDGELLGYDTLTDYISGLELAVSLAIDPAATWESNKPAFNGYVEAYGKAGHIKGLDALNAVARTLDSPR